MKGKSPAGPALATVLLELLDTIERTAAVVLRSTDPESLHDLRVAVRRSRSLLKLVGDLVPIDAAGDMPAELAWLAALTTPTRDLDVFIARLDSADAALEPFVRQLRTRRGVERRALRQGLRSERFGQFVVRWRSALEAAEPGDVLVRDVARERIGTAYRRVVRKAKRASSPTDLHTVRKRCKELRYLLEAFRPVCARPAYRALMKRLRRLQDELGALQDAQVRRTIVQESVSVELLPETLVAMGVLLGVDEAAAESHRAESVRRLQRFARPKVGRLVAGIVG